MLTSELTPPPRAAATSASDAFSSTFGLISTLAGFLSSEVVSLFAWLRSILAVILSPPILMTDSSV